MNVVATVGTTHPLAFAGLGFALLSLAAQGVRPVCVVAGVSAQDAARVIARAPVEPELIEAQFAALADAEVTVFHVGALVSASAVQAVAAGLDQYRGVPVVLDPVLAASGGDVLADAQTLAALRAELVPRATLVTPNLDEASALLERPVRDVEAMHEACEILCTEMGAHAALVKGGHLEGEAIDVFGDPNGMRALRAPRIDATLRGTGDLLATAVAARLAHGASLADAVQHARHRVREAIASGELFAGTRVARVL